MIQLAALRRRAFRGVAAHNAKGAFDTTDPVRSSPTYPQTITGSTNPGLMPAHGRAKVTNLTTGTASTGRAPLAAFKIITPSGATTNQVSQVAGSCCC
jgi:hypothetical protein